MLPTKLPKFEWSQDGSEKLEVRFSLSTLGASITPKALDVVVKEKDILCVKHDDTIVLQQKLHDNFALDNWGVENGDTLTVDLKKDDADMWPCLLRQPLPEDTPCFLHGEALDSLLRSEMTKLPRDEALEAEAGGDGEPKDDDDFDDLLDDALDEVVAATKKEEAAADDAADGEEEESTERGQQAVDYELKMTKEEFEQLEKLRQEAVEKLEKEDTEEEEKTKLTERIAMIDKMTELSKQVRRMRSKRPTMPMLLDILKLEIHKGRLNHGSMESEEIEEYKDDEEREMSGDELLKKGVAALENDIEDAMHLLRLAALHHNHAVSTCLLQRLYTQMRVLPKAAYFVYRRALQEDKEPSTNLIIGEFADKGMPLFPPYMALVVYFYQRSAAVGSTHAMLTLANTYKQGAVTASPASAEARELNSDNDKFLQWLQVAEDRGSPRAYFIKASLHTTGECGQTKSAKLAKQYLDRVKKTEPSILQKAPGLENRITQMLREEDGGASTPATSSPTSAGPSTAVAPRAQQSAASRLSALEAGNRGSATSGMDTRPAASRSGMLSNRRNNASANRIKGFLETSLKIGIGCYFAYCMAFPLRIIISPQAFAMMAYFMDLFGFGRYIIQPSMPPGMMM